MNRTDMETLRALCREEGFVEVAETCLGMALEEYGGTEGGACVVAVPVGFVKKKYREQAVGRILGMAMPVPEGMERSPDIDGGLPVGLVYEDADMPEYPTEDAAGLDLSAHSVAGEESARGERLRNPPLQDRHREHGGGGQHPVRPRRARVRQGRPRGKERPEARRVRRRHRERRKASRAGAPA